MIKIGLKGGVIMKTKPKPTPPEDPCFEHYAQEERMNFNIH